MCEILECRGQGNLADVFFTSIMALGKILAASKKAVSCVDP